MVLKKIYNAVCNEEVKCSDCKKAHRAGEKIVAIHVRLANIDVYSFMCHDCFYTEMFEEFGLTFPAMAY